MGGVHGGQVTGTYYPDMDPNGSSSGSGVGSSIGLPLQLISYLSSPGRTNMITIRKPSHLTHHLITLRHSTFPATEEHELEYLVTESCNGITPDNTSQPILDAFEVAIQVIKYAGANTINNTKFSVFDDYLTNANKALGNESIVLDADFVSDPSNYLAQLTSNPNNIHSLADESNFTHTFPLEDYSERDTAMWDQALSLGHNNTDPRLAEAYY